MSARKKSLPTDGLKTWVEIDKKAAKSNLETFRGIISPEVKLWSVVKSNAYGHGILDFTRMIDEAGVDGFCVDSVKEGETLRKIGVKKPILVVGHTEPNLYGSAVLNNITLSVATHDDLDAMFSTDKSPDFHIKVDTGMHRRGFLLSDISRVISKIRSSKSDVRCCPSGIYTHFASAKDINYPSYTNEQIKKLENAILQFKNAGFKKLVCHASATGGTMLGKKYHLDAVRVGIGLYGLWPARDLETQLSHKISLFPVLSWRAKVSEIKTLEIGDYIGYDLVERMTRPVRVAVIPVGYWHGLPRSLSQMGEVLIRGKRARILGRVSMDIISVDATDIPGVKVGDVATLIGKDGSESISAEELAQKSGTINYEIVTRINPLIQRVVIDS